MEKGQEEKALDTKYPRKLDYNAPLLSTRRPARAGAGSQLIRTSSLVTWRDTRNRVPFSWEKTPGEPKDVESEEAGVPPPKLPPARWRPPKSAAKVGNVDDDDDGCEGDVEDDNHNDDDDVFSDAIDVFSLADSVDKPEASEKVGVAVEHGGVQSPSFMIRRFLTDALAAASSTTVVVSSQKVRHRQCSRQHCDFPAAGRRSSSPLKGCGIDAYFPWLVRHNPCGVKSPVREATLNVKPQCGGRRKRRC
ncbi:hypothetical protein NMG60_11000146 [Bertholletia excelsa]